MPLDVHVYSKLFLFTGPRDRLFERLRGISRIAISCAAAPSMGMAWPSSTTYFSCSHGVRAFLSQHLLDNIECDEY